MTRIIATALLALGLATSASAQGIQPVTEPEYDVTVGSQDVPVIAIVAGVAAVIAVAALIGGDDDDEPADGTR